ncbi:MAG: dihydropteroate synthase [Bacteroidota bacterium]
MKSINIGGNVVALDRPKVMGILNVTPDSFYEGSRVQHIDATLEVASQMLSEGADFLDIGGYSSRPGADDIAVSEEIHRVVEPIRQISAAFPEAILSIDTFRSEVAVAAIEAGAHIINDISGGHLDEAMHSVAGHMRVPYIGMHMRGTPQTMKQLAQYDDLLTEIGKYFAEMVDSLQKEGVKDIILDPGFGFAKTVDHNFQLLDAFEYFRFLELPLLAGLSRKSMIYKTLEISANNALNGTTVLNTVALLRGADILRVHDVKEAVQTIALINRLGP